MIERCWIAAGALMKVWFPIFAVLFVATEAFQWLKEIALPTPIFVVGGNVLAIASNWGRRAGIPFKWFGIYQEGQGAIAPTHERSTTSEPTPVQFQELKPRTQAAKPSSDPAKK
ncbi:MAG: hypothetical protein ACFCBU_04225 [Cyanophyceae cyanobacterium]